MHGCTILCAYLCWQSFSLRGKCSHSWECVGWCKWSFVQVGDTHLPVATFFFHVAGLAQVPQPLHTLASANDFQVWGLNTSVKLVGYMHTLFRGWRPHFMSKPILHLMCLNNVVFFVYYSPFYLVYMTNLWHFCKCLLDGLMQICTTWCFSFHTSICFPKENGMPPNIQKCKLKQTQWHSTQFQRWWHPQTHNLSVNTPCLALQFHIHGCTILCANLCWES